MNDVIRTSNEHAAHELKIASQFFEVVESGQKPFEIRKGDRPFKIGDTLWLREVDITLAYTGREMRKRITFCLRGWGMESGYVALGLAPPGNETCDDLTDKQRLDFLEAWIQLSKEKGLKWDTFAFDTATEVREQIDQRIVAGMAEDLNQRATQKACEHCGERHAAGPCKDAVIP